MPDDIALVLVGRVGGVVNATAVGTKLLVVPSPLGPGQPSAAAGAVETLTAYTAGKSSAGVRQRRFQADGPRARGVIVLIVTAVAARVGAILPVLRA